MRAHIEPLARRGDQDAVALLVGPPFPHSLHYLFELFGELLLWCDGRPTWKDIQPWAVMMQRTFSPWELRALRQISDAFFESVTNGD